MDISAEKTICKTFRHSINKTYVHTEGEYTLFFYSKSKKELESIIKVSLEDYEVILDNNLKIAHHLGRHSDPHNIYNYKDGYLMQIIIYGENARKIIESGVNVYYEDGVLEFQNVTIKNNDFEEYDSELINRDGSFFIKIKSNNLKKISLTYQYIENGHFREDFIPEINNNLIKVPVIKGEYFGVSISNSNILGGLEHKHIILGHIGVPSGKILYDLETDKEYYPRMRNYSLYKSYIINFNNENYIDKLEKFISDKYYDDLTIYTNIKLNINTLNKKVSIVTYGESYENDIVILNLKDDPIDKPHSYFLFKEQTEQFPEELSYFFNFVNPNKFTFENPWLNIVEDKFLFKNYEYGISYTINKKDIFNKALLQEKKISIKNKYCNQCVKYSRCRNILSFPYGDISNYVLDNNCHLKKYI